MTGVASTLVLHPTNANLSDITFTCDADTTDGYIPDLGSLLLGEGERLSIVYSEGVGLEGGSVAGYRGPLVAVKFDVIIRAESRAGLLQNAAELIEVTADDQGGTLEYKPDGLSAAAMSSFYPYLKSKPPSVLQQRGNRWDAPAVTGGTIYTMILSVELMTLPVAWSDPDTAVSVHSSDTVDNIDDGADDFLTVLGANLKGSLSALTRLRITPTGTGAASVGRLFIAQRTEGLTNFEATYLTSGAAVGPSGVWSTPSDAARCNGAYYLLTPAATNVIYGRRFTISNWDDHKGRAAIAIVAKVESPGPSDFDIWYGVTMGEVMVEGEAKHVTLPRQWEIVILGEIDLPPTELSGLTDMDLYVDIYFKRTAGYGTAALDALKLLYSDLGALCLDVQDGVGVSSSYRLVVDTLTGEEVAQVLAVADDKICDVPNVHGPFIYLDPVGNNRLDLLWERYRLADVADDISGHAIHWQQIATLDTDEAWTDHLDASVTDKTGDDEFIEGDGAKAWNLPGSSPEGLKLVLDEAISLADWADGDYFTLAVYTEYTSAPSALSCTLLFRSHSLGGSLQRTETITIQDASWQVVKFKKTDFSESSNPTWGSVGEILIYIEWTGGTGLAAWCDDLKVVAADPNDAAEFDPTGGDWNENEPSWSGFTDVATVAHPYWLGWTRDEPNVAGGRHLLTLADTHAGDVQIKAHFYKEQYKNRGGGIAFCFSDVTVASEDGYIFELEGHNLGYGSTLRVFEYTGGSGAAIGTALVADIDDFYFWLGVQRVGDEIYCYFSKTEAELFTPASLVIQVTDSTQTGTIHGISARYGFTRFTAFEIKEIKDLHVPADQVNVTAHAVFRSVTPFYEE